MPADLINWPYKLGTSVEEYSNEIDEAMGRMETGEYYTQDEAKEILKKI